jgi:hypothetical protein
MGSNPEIKFNFNVHEICENNKILMDKTGTVLIPLFRLIDDIACRKSYNIQQIFYQGSYFDYSINNTKMKINYEIYNNIDPNQSIILYNKYIYDYTIYKAGANYNIAQINYYYSNQILNTYQNILNIINPLYNLVEKVNQDINKSYDVSLSFAKRIEWKTYMQPLKDQYDFLNEQKDFTIKQIQNLQIEIQDLGLKLPIFYNYYNKLVNTPTFIPLSVLPPPLQIEPMPISSNT